MKSTRGRGLTNSGKMGRTGRSLVKVENDDSGLRLRFTDEDKRFAIALTLLGSEAIALLNKRQQK